MRVRERFANVFLRLYQSNATWIVAWVMFVLIGTAVFSIVCWRWLNDGESGSTTIRNLGLVVAAIIALPLAIWRSIVAERQAATAQRQSETAQRGLLNERYQKGAEMLGSKVLAVRLGGIYALERLAREHPEDYHLQIMSLLCAFARNPPPSGKEDAKVREDVRAIMTAVVEHSEAQIEREKQENYRLDFSRANLKGAFPERAVPADANLEGAFLDNANLEGAFLYRANLKGASPGPVNTSGHNHVIMRRWNSRKPNTNGSRHTCRCSAATSAFRTSRCSTPSCMSPSMAANGAGYPHGLATGTPSTPV